VGDAYREGLSRFMRERCLKHGIAYGYRNARVYLTGVVKPEAPESGQMTLSFEKDGGGQMADNPGVSVTR
jgi:hypothetical protein